MIRPRQLIRLFGIQRVLIRHGVDELILQAPLLRSIRFVLYLLPWNWFQTHSEPRAVRTRKVFEDLGPIFVKFGQILSTRRDLLPDDIAEELARLQDAVPPFPGDQARAICERAFDQEVESLFPGFQETPLASASIAQVHAAQLQNGQEVILKVVRPGIRKLIERDLELMFLVAGLLERYWSHGRELKPVDVVAEFKKTIIDELDMLREAANASQLRRNFLGSDRIYVPEVYWDLSRREVLCMERISGTRVDRVEELRAAGVDMKQLAEDGVEIFFTQVFRDHFFHADMHPGNLFVSPGSDGERARFIPVDFGICSSLSEFDQRYLAENFRAFLDRDYRRVAELHVESGWVPRDTRVDDFESAIRTVCEPIFDRPLKEISVGRLLLRLFQTAQRFHMKILPQLLLLQKTIVNVEGIGRQLYPDLDLWAAARPPLESWMRDQLGGKRLLRATREQVPRWAERLPELPGLAINVLDKARTGELEVRYASDDLALLTEEIQRQGRRQSYTLVGAVALLGALLIYTLAGPEVSRWFGIPVASWLLAGASALLFAHARRR